MGNFPYVINTLFYKNLENFTTFTCFFCIYRWGAIVYPELAEFPDWAEKIVNATATTTTTIAPMIASTLANVVTT